MRAVAVPGRWVWGLSGLVIAAAIAIPVTRLITMAGVPVLAPPQDVATRIVTVSQPVTSLTVDTYGGQVQVTAGPVSRVHVTETTLYDQKGGGLPAVAQSVSGGRLSLGDPACQYSDCSVDFAVTVPPGLTVTVATQGDPVSVSGTAGANVDSDGGPVDATRIGGPLTVATNGGPLVVNGLTGPLRADTSGRSLSARGVAATTATATTDGGDAMIAFTRAADTVTVSTGGGAAAIAFAEAPDMVLVSTDGGSAVLTLPGGPYAVTADSGGGPQWVGIATNPAARPSITVTSGGAPLRIQP
jgi:hypothetical protein